MGGTILLSQLCIFLCISLVTLAWVALKSTRQKQASIHRFRKELKRQGVPKELVKRMAKRYGKTVNWFELLKSRGKRL